MSRFFINRPIFATVLALIMLLAGVATMFTLPIAQFPTIVPPTVQVSAVYNGADAETVAQAVTSPIEQQINGVQGMLYMSSNSTSTGQSIITCTFEVGYDLNIAAVDVQNRAQQAFLRADAAALERIEADTRSWQRSPDPMALYGYAFVKLRVMQSPGYVKAYESFGAQPTPMAYGDVYMALQQGVVDGADTSPDQFVMDKFIEVSKAGFDKGVSILHFLGGTSIHIEGNRAIAQTKMTISQRGMVEGEAGPVLCDVVCTGRFHDFVEKHEGEWKLLHRQPIYEKDRIDPVDPVAVLQLDQQALAAFPEGYRHLAYIQTRIGYKVKMDMPMLKGEGVQDLYRRGANWLAGKPLER